VSGWEPEDELAAADVVRGGEDEAAGKEDDWGTDKFGGGGGGNGAEDAAEELAMGSVLAIDTRLSGLGDLRRKHE
jgi:hypothetical protein